MNSNDIKEEDFWLPEGVEIVEGSFEEFYEMRFGKQFRNDLENGKKANDPHMFGLVKPLDKARLKIIWSSVKQAKVR